MNIWIVAIVAGLIGSALGWALAALLNAAKRADECADCELAQAAIGALGKMTEEVEP